MALYRIRCFFLMIKPQCGIQGWRMNLNQLIWERIRKQLREKKEEGFEEIYILTYQQLYRDVIQAVGREE